MYAVVGSTGQVGGAVARALRADGREVRAILRDEAKGAQLRELGAELYPTSVEDAAHLEIAFEGVEGVFLMIPPLLDAPNPRGENKLILAAAVHALQASHVPKVVLLSSIGAHLAEGTGLILKTHDLEEAIFPIGMPVASIRAATFMDNLKPMLGHIRETGKWPTPLERLDRPMELVETEDIGKLAARLLTEPWGEKRIIEFEGPRAYSITESAALLSRAMNRAVAADTVPRARRAPMFQQFGMSATAAAEFIEMEDGMDAGTLTFEGGDGIEHLRGETTFEQWLAGALEA